MFYQGFQLILIHTKVKEPLGEATQQQQQAGVVCLILSMREKETWLTNGHLVTVTSCFPYSLGCPGMSQNLEYTLGAGFVKTVKQFLVSLE